MINFINQLHRFLTSLLSIAPYWTDRLEEMDADFQNRRGMQEGSGRRVNKVLRLDIRSVNVLNEKEISDFIQTYPQLQNITLLREEPVSNLQLFRYYAERHLLQHPEVNLQMDILIAEKEPTQMDLPLQVNFFLQNMNWKAYEHIQSDIFEHLMIAASKFGLKSYQ